MTQPDGSLTPEQVRKFHEDGYLVIPNFFDASPVLEHSRSVVGSFDPSTHPLTKFTTGETSDHVGDRYFLTSGTNISYFLEEGAVDESGKLTCAKERAINKVGHALHQLDPVFRDFSFSSRIQAISRSLGAHIDPVVLQSMIICKQPSIGGAVPSHNDSTFLYTEPPSAVGMWFALEDCTTSNGCLSFMPGSHRWPRGKDVPPSPLRPVDSLASELGQPRGVNRRFVRRDPANVDAGTTFETLALDEEVEWDDSKARIEECKAGSLVLIHGSVMHKSEKNTSDKSRFIYTFHLVEGDANSAVYDSKNWLQPTEDMPFPKLYSYHKS